MISGYCDEKFSSARELFENNLNSGFERGAAITVEIEGEKVIDLGAELILKKKIQLGRKIQSLMSFLLLKV